VSRQNAGRTLSGPQRWCPGWRGQPCKVPTSGCHTAHALLCRAAHWVLSSSPLGPSKGRKAWSPLHMASCVGARYAALPSAGQVRGRPRLPRRMGRVICAASSPSSRGSHKMASTPSTALLSARWTPWTTGYRYIPEADVPPAVGGCHAVEASGLVPLTAGPAARPSAPSARWPAADAAAALPSE
jgi:hypothetical protein